MIPEKSRQERIDAIFEEELHAKPRDENFKPKLVSGGYTVVTSKTVWGEIKKNEIIFVTHDEYRPYTVHDSFDRLGLAAEHAANELKKLNKAFEELSDRI